MTDKMPEYGWVIQTEDGPSKYWNSSGFGKKYISEQKHAEILKAKLGSMGTRCLMMDRKHAEEITALKAEHRAEMAGLCDEIESLSNYVAAFNTDLNYKVVLAELSEIKQRISDD